jgi:hypothetical protein
MSSIKRTAADKFRVLREAVADEILSMTDEEVLKDTRDTGVDPEEIASIMRSKIFDTIANVRKQKLKNIRETLNSVPTQTQNNKQPTMSFGLEEKKRKIMELIAKPNNDFSLAFRNGERQSESDWESLWDDMVEMGLIKDDHTKD